MARSIDYYAASPRPMGIAGSFASAALKRLRKAGVQVEGMTFAELTERVVALPPFEFPIYSAPRPRLVYRGYYGRRRR